MGIFLKNKKTEEVIAVVYIGSSTIRAAMVRIPISKTELPAIVRTIKSEINFNGQNLTITAFTKSMLKSLNSVVDSLYHSKSGLVPERIVCVLSAPWYSSEIRRINIKKEVSFEFDEKLANELIKKEITLVENKHSDDRIKLDIIENHIMSVSLNGYQVDNPIGMRTNSVEINMVISFSYRSFLDKIKEVISRTFHDTPVSFSSFIMSSYFVVQDRYHNPDSYLLLDIGGEITEVGIVSKEVLKSSLSFPFGKKTLLKYISTKLEKDMRDAKELFHLYSTGHLSEAEKNKLKPLFDSIQKSWSESFRQSVGELPHVLALPSNTFITADEDILDWFTGVVRNEEFLKSMTINHNNTIIPLRSSEFSKMCKITKDATPDLFLMIATSAIKKIKDK